jgi:hypothetical protein
MGEGPILGPESPDFLGITAGQSSFTAVPGRQHNCFPSALNSMQQGIEIETLTAARSAVAVGSPPPSTAAPSATRSSPVMVRPKKSAMFHISPMAVSDVLMSTRCAA